MKDAGRLNTIRWLEKIMAAGYAMVEIKYVRKRQPDLRPRTKKETPLYIKKIQTSMAK